MNILIVDRYFYPDSQATSVLLTDLAEDLSKDFGVHVLCGPASDFKETPTRYPERVKIFTVPSSKLNQHSLIGRLINYATFLFLTPFFILFHSKVDSVLVGTSPPLLPFFLSFACRLRRFPYVYLCNDYFPNTAVLSGWLKESWLSHILKLLNLDSMAYASCVVVIGRDMKELLIRDEIPEDRIEVIPNWANTNEIKPVTRSNSVSRKYRLGHYFIVMHSGNFGLVQDFDFMLEIAEKLKTEEKIRMVFVGNGAMKKQVQNLANQKHLSNVIFLDFQQRANISEILASADLHLISLKKGLAGNSVPSKTYSLLASGRPILGLLEKSSETARLIEEAGCGIILEGQSAPEAAGEIKKLTKDTARLSVWGKSARSFSEKMNFRGSAFKKYREVLIKAAK